LHSTGYSAFAAGPSFAHVPLSKMSDMMAKYMLFVPISPRLLENSQIFIDRLLATDYVSSSNKFPLEISGMATCLFFAQIADGTFQHAESRFRIN
jgi:hypothetical protein